jgi:hypothetical protein
MTILTVNGDNLKMHAWVPTIPDDEGNEIPLTNLQEWRVENAQPASQKDAINLAVAFFYAEPIEVGFLMNNEFFYTGRAYVTKTGPDGVDLRGVGALLRS